MPQSELLDPVGVRSSPKGKNISTEDNILVREKLSWKPTLKG